MRKISMHIYGATTPPEIAELCIRVSAECGLIVEFLQSNYEGEIVEWIQTAIVMQAPLRTHRSPFMTPCASTTA